MSKTYIFEVELKSKGRGTVIADSKEERRSKRKNLGWRV